MASLRPLALVCALTACRSASEDYDAYLQRTCRGAVATAGPVSSRFEDLSGRWLVHALLAGGLDLGLKMQLAMNGSALHARLWLAAADPATAPPILETDTMVGSDGTFVLRAEPLELGPGALNVDSTVEANVVLSASTLAPDAWCGTASGDVSKPLMLDLAGSTFAARHDDGQTTMAEVPTSCMPGASQGCGMNGPVRPPAPDLSSVTSRLADLTGQWILSARLAGSLPQKLWVSLEFVAGAPGMGGSLDGALRKATDPPGAPALLTFSTAVGPDGRFALWLPGVSIGSVRADLLLVAATISADGFCGKGAGQVQEPLMLDLKGTTFGAARWTPGTPLPTTVPVSCP